MPKDKDFFKEALIGKKVPLLVLDHQWHKLFTQTGDNENIHTLENEINELLKKQGRLNMDIKSLTSYKKTLMSEIVSIMELDDSPEKEKKMGENKRLIEETNLKIESAQDELLDLPKLIDEKNFELMLETMDVCYEKIKSNTDEINDINQWIKDFRDQLKKKVLIKQKKQIWNDELYSYMHAIFGPDVIEMFDMKYNPQNVIHKEEENIDNPNT